MAAISDPLIHCSPIRSTGFHRVQVRSNSLIRFDFVELPYLLAVGVVLLARGVPTDDDPLLHPAQWPLGVFEEWVQVVGPVVLVALLLGLPAWWARRKAVPEPAPEPAPAAPEAGGSCLQCLPAALGTDLIAARSELQYVRVYTTRGDALVLGALKDIAEQRGAEAQLTHRTWWVSDRHVRTLRRRGARYVLTLSNGLEVPVGRRRQPALIQRFGASATLN